MNRPKNLLPALLLAFAIETLSVTWCLKIPGAAPYLGLLYGTSGVAIAWLLTRVPALTLPTLQKKWWRVPAIQHRFIVVLLAGLALWSWCVYWFDEMPIDITNADMLPIIKVMGDRFIAGQHSHIYDNIPWIWHGTRPIYLPAMWLPYVPAIFAGIDMRWIAVAGLLFAFAVFILLYRPSQQPDVNPSARQSLHFYLGVLSFLLFWWIVADNTAGIVSVAEEGTVIGYYVLLVLALVSGKPWLTGIAISLCMLSRYALVGWIPAYVVYLILGKKWKYLGIVTLTGILCFVLLFLVPVGWTTFIRLASLPGDYVSFAARVWKDSPDTFSTAPAFAWFFGPKRIWLLHGLLLVFSFAAPLVFMLFLRRRRAGNPPRAEDGATATNLPQAGSPPLSANLPLATLKIALVIFFCFIDVPYLYLFYTSSFVSLIAVTLALRAPAEMP
jgi:hypothetical protein